MTTDITQCTRCGGRIVTRPDDAYGSDRSCIVCGAAPPSAAEMAAAVAFDEAVELAHAGKARRRQPSIGKLKL